MSKLRLGSEYIPLVDEDMSKIRLVLPFSKVALYTVSLPLMAFIFCIIWSILYNFEHSTSTHCKVYNFLPSVSAAIGHYKPQKDIWKISIAIQAFIRSIIWLMNYRYYKEHVYKWAQFISHIVVFTNALENVSLVTLSFWTSNESYAFHKLSFITFLISSFIHMFVLYYLLSHCCNNTKDLSDATSLTWKWRLMMCNVGFIFAAVYFFYRHNRYCEPIVYSLFALSEYGVVLSNMGFHSTIIWDYPVSRILISSNGLRQLEMGNFDNVVLYCR